MYDYIDFEKAKITNRNLYRNTPPPKKKKVLKRVMANTDPWIYQRWDQLLRRNN